MSLQDNTLAYPVNFRDASTFNSLMKPGIIFRSSSLTTIQDIDGFRQIADHHLIKTIIDLRAVREAEASPYQHGALLAIDYVHAPLDPWNQPAWFREQFNVGSNIEIAYRFFGMACHEQLGLALRAILQTQEGAIAVHCLAGKDRTGILVSLLHLLTEALLEVIYTDYLASEVELKKEYLDIILEIVKQQGGIHAYLENCGLKTHEIKELKSKLTHE